MNRPHDPTAALPVRLAAKMHDDITAGVWTGHLPGTRSLSAHYKVSRKTCAESLLLLEKKKVIAPAEMGKKRRITINPSAQDGRESGIGTLLVLHCVTQNFSARHLSNVNVIQSEWNESGGHVVFRVVDYERYSRPKSRLVELIRRYEAKALVLITPREEWLIEASGLLPTYSMGGAWLDTVKNATAHGFDFCHQVDQVLTYLHQYGQRRLMIPNYHEGPLAGIFEEAVQAGYRRFLAAHPGAGDLSLHIPNFVSADPDEWFRFWRDSLRKYEPTVVIPVQTIHLQSLYGFCRASNIVIPRDLSVFCMEHIIESEWMWPRPHTQKHSEKSVRKCFQKWISSGLQALGMRELSLEIVEGDSVHKIGQ